MYANPAIPPGYIVVKGEDTLALGPKVETNDWHALVGEYWLILFWLFFLMLLIILLPFIGLGAVIAFLSNRLLDHGIVEAANSMRQGTKDICAFLKDVKEHIHHLFGNNYEEMLNHLTDTLTNSHTHIFFDLGDTSEANALEELQRILDNLPSALDLMKDVVVLEKKLRYFGDQLRDGIRGIKRDLNNACQYASNTDKFLDFLRNTLIEFIDTSVCLHMDELPHTSVYVQGIMEIIDSKAHEIPKEGIKRFQHVSDVIKAATDKVAPPLISDITKGRDTMLQHANRIQDIVDAIISDIHLNTLRSTQSFEDFYVKYGIHRRPVNMFACTVIFVIIGALIVALISGFCARRTTGATCLLLAIILIFCAISFITLIGLFYFILGIATYHGGCAPFKKMEASEVFRMLDAVPVRLSNRYSIC
ncbi:prominin-like protein [Drosophila innubila]|uniref:prominin-like protein n=1 Tax=Drosophila innubila TaxID=198719 RepID=UPI00148D4FB3|nr:prominin-like protein [Drosophila innubila]